MTAEQYIKSELERFLKQNEINDIPILLEQPKQKQFGDVSSNLAMQLASRLKKNPRIIADEILEFINQDQSYISKMDIAGAGFINFFITDSSVFEQLRQILKQKENFGKENLGKGKKTQVEFISANPTGPLTIGHGRQAVLGDTIARLLDFFGYDITREYYYNESGICNKLARILSFLMNIIKETTSLISPKLL